MNKLEEKRATCPCCCGIGYIHDEDGYQDCSYCDGQGKVPEELATYEAFSKGL
jgi:hypothetical protein